MGGVETEDVDEVVMDEEPDFWGKAEGREGL